jgi:hypothetical protein
MYAHWLARLQTAPKARTAGSRRRAALRRRPAIESLEGRQLLSTVFKVTTGDDTPAGTADEAGSSGMRSTRPTPSPPIRR